MVGWWIVWIPGDQSWVMRKKRADAFGSRVSVNWSDPSF
jgi:hypothetical protein